MRKVLGASIMAGGAILSAVSTLLVIKWLDLDDRGDRLRAEVPANVTDACAAKGNPADTQSGGKASELCNTSEKAQVVAPLAIATGISGVALIATGAYFFLTDAPSATAQSAARKPSSRVRLLPAIGTTSGSMVLSGSF